MRPAHVAIVGASPGSIGADALANLERFAFPGPIHLVSRTMPEVNGRPCVANIDDLPRGIDVALLCVPRDAVIDSVDACVRRGVGAAIVFASGFAETGEAGLADQHALARIAQDRGIAIWGPTASGSPTTSTKLRSVSSIVRPMPFPPDRR